MLPLLLVLLAAAPSFAAPQISATIDAAAAASLDRVFAFDFDGAQAELRKIEAEDASHPFGPFGEAAVSWARYVYESQQADPELGKQFEKNVDRAVASAEAWIKGHPDDPNGYLVLGGAYGMRSRLAVIQNRFLRALVDGRRAIKATRQANKIDPKYYDAYLGIGMWEYYADVFPRFVKVLGNFFLGGDRLAGIEHLKLAATKGHLVNVAAELLLIEVYTEDRFGAKNPKLALSMIESLRRRYPFSPVFHQIEQVCYYVAGDMDGVERVTQEYVDRIDTHQPYYPESDKARMRVAFGVVRMVRRDLMGAEREFQQAAAMAGDKKKPSRWGVWGLLRLGEVDDALGRRDAARKEYRQVLDYPDVWGFHEVAKGYLDHPYRFDGHPGQLPPP